MDLHLRIEGDVAGAIEIELHAPTDHAGTEAYLDCRRVSYEEIGGEAFNARRHKSRHAVEQETLDELQRLLSSSTTQSNAPSELDGTTFTLTIGRGADAVEYSWCSRPPAEWKSLREIVRILVASAGVDAYVDLQPDLRVARGASSRPQRRRGVK